MMKPWRMERRRQPRRSDREETSAALLMRNDRAAVNNPSLTTTHDCDGRLTLSRMLFEGKSRQPASIIFSANFDHYQLLGFS